MKKQCPRCDTIVEPTPGVRLVCPECGFGGSPGEGRSAADPLPGAPPRRFSFSQITTRIGAINWPRFPIANPVLKFVSEGRVFAKTTATVLRALAVLVALGGMAAWLWSWRFAFSLEGIAGAWGTTLAVAGGVVFLVTAFVAIYLVVHILWIRARQVAGLSHAEFTVIPITSVFLRTVGEAISAAVAVVGGVGVGLMTMLAGPPLGGHMREGIPFLEGWQGNLLVGATVLTAGILAAIVVLALFYFIAEAMVVAVAIAKHGERTSRALESLAQDPDSPPADTDVRTGLVTRLGDG